jgi:hypothetical protein
MIAECAAAAISELHPEHAEVGALDRGVERGGQAERQDRAGLRRIDDAVVPQAGACIVRVALALVLSTDRRLEGILSDQLCPARSRPSRRTWASTLAACSPPMTEMRAFGHSHKKRGP